MIDWPVADELARRSTYGDHSIGHLLYALALSTGARGVVELGYYAGYSALWLCAGMHASGETDLCMVSVDLNGRDRGHNLH